MTVIGWIQIVVFFLIILALTKPLGTFMFRVFEGEVRPLPHVERFGFGRGDAGQIGLSWSEADEGVCVEFSPTLVPTAQWQTAIGPLDGVTNLALPIPTNGPQGYYRIRAP